MSLDTRTFVVTGASRGIGCEIAETLGEEGATVVVNHRSSEAAARDTVEAVEATGGRAYVAKADVTDRDAVTAMREQVHDAVGPIDGLVNNAGITADTSFDEMTPQEWNRVIDVNLNGAFTCTKAFYDDLKAAEHGRLINVSSIIGKQGNYGQANYAAAKSGLFGFTRSLAIELAPTGTTANCIAPGYTDTEMVQAVPERYRESLQEDIPLGRFAKPEEIAHVVAFLASERAGYVTGEVLDVNGGMDL